MRALFYTILFLISCSVCVAQISIQTNVPPTIAPNATLNIEVKISKGSIANFAKYQMDVPAGVTMAEGDSKTGNFTFEAGRAKIVWVSIPTDAEFIVSFVMYSGTVTGTAIINHKFFYLDNGAKQETEMEPINVKFDASGTTWAAALTPIAGSAASAGSSTVASGGNNEPVVTNNSTPEVKPNTVNNTPETSSSSLVYKLQLGAYAADPGKSKFASVGKVSVSNEGGFYKVLFGNFKSKEEALAKRSELSSKGFDSFVVAYQNGQRVK